MALASLHSLAGHRISELTDSVWLHEHEQDREASEIHALPWRVQRARVATDQRRSDSLTDRLVARLYGLRSIQLWFWTMSLISLTALVVLVISAVHPQLLSH